MPNNESNEEQRIWHSGPPPFPGWWNASTTQYPDSWRWWNGRFWSLPCYPHMWSHVVFKRAQVRNAYTVEWNDYWPENARVPRVAPQHAPECALGRSPGSLASGRCTCGAVRGEPL